MVEPRPKPYELPKASDRLTFLYLEHARIGVDDGALKVIHDRRAISVPAAMFAVILLGPGSSITHAAIRLLSDVGTMTVWCGADGTRTYSLTAVSSSSARYSIRQAAIVSDPDLRMRAARDMYAIRFHDPAFDVSTASMNTLRGMEGARMKGLYRRLAQETGMPWTGRNPRTSVMQDPVNASMTIGNTILYSVQAAVITALGASTSLGVIHTGIRGSFTLDMADLYKAETSIPNAFHVAADIGDPADRGLLDSMTRRGMRELMSEKGILTRSVHDINTILHIRAGTDPGNGCTIIDTPGLWDIDGTVDMGTNYALA